MKEKIWYVYIILTEKNKLYTGITIDVDRRFQEHSGLLPRGAKFFRSDKPEKVVYVEGCQSRSEALVKEAKIKSLTRLQKENFIKESENGGNKIHGRRKKKSTDVAGSTRTSKKR